jgi:hypothetical protein
MNDVSLRCLFFIASPNVSAAVIAAVWFEE